MRERTQLVTNRVQEIELKHHSEDEKVTANSILCFRCMRVHKKFGIFALHYDMGFSFVLHPHLLNVPNTKTGNEKWLNLYLEKTMRIET